MRENGILFATSHGKSPSDGIWGTVKRLTACASLQMTSGQVFQWCQDVSGISFIYVSSQDINNHVNQFQLDQCHELTKTVPGTRSYHSFIPDGLSNLRLWKISKDSFSTAFQFNKATLEILINDIQVRNYYACIQDNEWHICITTDISFEKQMFILSLWTKANTMPFLGQEETIFAGFL